MKVALERNLTGHCLTVCPGPAIEYLMPVDPRNFLSLALIDMSLYSSKHMSTSAVFPDIAVISIDLAIDEYVAPIFVCETIVCRSNPPSITLAQLIGMFFLSMHYIAETLTCSVELLY